MKRCPQCDFTFEDYRQVCDFDGTELTAAPEVIVSAPTVPTPAAVRPLIFRRFSGSRLSLAALALAGVILSALLIGYYDSTNQGDVDTVSIAPTANSAGPTTSKNLERDQVAKPRSISTQRRIKANEKVSSMPGSLLRPPSETYRFRASRTRPGPHTSTLQANTLGKGKAAGRFQARNQKRLGTVDKKDSKVVAILKKTGSILTKPFRL
jgi:hypothetical protein